MNYDLGSELAPSLVGTAEGLPGDRFLLSPLTLVPVLPALASVATSTLADSIRKMASVVAGSRLCICVSVYPGDASLP